MLMTAGYLVLTAASGDVALRIVEDDLSGAVELVIADVMMPGMNGPEVASGCARQLRLRVWPSG